jgi:hypothetical protein
MIRVQTCALQQTVKMKYFHVSGTQITYNSFLYKLQPLCNDDSADLTSPSHQVAKIYHRPIAVS